jgi:hypothetical protein
MTKTEFLTRRLSALGSNLQSIADKYQGIDVPVLSEVVSSFVAILALLEQEEEGEVAVLDITLDEAIDGAVAKLETEWTATQSNS